MIRKSVASKHSRVNVIASPFQLASAAALFYTSFTRYPQPPVLLCNICKADQPDSPWPKVTFNICFMLYDQLGTSHIQTLPKGSGQLLNELTKDACEPGQL